MAKQINRVVASASPLQRSKNKHGLFNLDNNRNKRHQFLDVVLAKTQGCCFYCGDKIAFRDMTASVDHIVPKDDGGTDDIENLIAACKPCNGAKGNRSLEQFRSSLQKMAGNRAITFYGENDEHK
jgi:5-methylcytosine-specific restriction endonuclease McrA